MSGYSEDSFLHSEVFTPGARFLEKPFGPSDLAEKVREVLDAPTASLALVRIG